ALSATAHWLFDRHLISLTDDYGLLVSHNRIPSELQALFQKQLQRVRLPENQAYWPRPEYLRRHRAAYDNVG
ncbi:MAG: HNH endonuclease, partial [Reyranella sp.]